MQVGTDLAETLSQEDKQYKHDAYSVRHQDAYALSKDWIILNWLPQNEGLRVLNAGCGSGEMTALLAQQASWQVDAIDNDPEAIRLSELLAERLSLTNIQLFEVGIESHIGSDYDIIVCIDVLEHLPEPDTAVARLVQMLKPGGTFCASVPALQWLFGYHDRMLGHYRRYNQNTLRALLSPYLRVEYCRYFGFALIPIAMWYSLLLRKNYPVSESMSLSFRARILELFLKLERKVPLPWGTSVLALATAPENV
jgi:2-polyprenyl-3-methyl-5-hydroxy-6-metoxy-1,4-benzoquinol methylase